MNQPRVPRMPLEDLYQEVILDHNRRPRNYKVPDHPDTKCHAYNPLCGDDYYIYLNVNEGMIQDVGFQGSGCAISKSSASMMTTKIKGKKIEEALTLKDQFIELVTKDIPESERGASLGSLAIFEGVKKFPIRVKCATMIWHALKEALTQLELGAQG